MLPVEGEDPRLKFAFMRAEALVNNPTISPDDQALLASYLNDPNTTRIQKIDHVLSVIEFKYPSPIADVIRREFNTVCGVHRNTGL